jgi:hypothetical protein
LSDLIRLAKGELAVEFTWRHDRYAHRVMWLRDGVESLVLESIEGDASTHWPISPPLQHVHVEERPNDVVVALAVGMAGRSHWSMSVELEPKSRRLAFDVACRCHQQPGRLGSSYGLAHNAWQLVVHDDAMFDGELRIVPRATIEKLPATVRWRYALEKAESREP